MPSRTVLDVKHGNKVKNKGEVAQQFPPLNFILEKLITAIKVTSLIGAMTFGIIAPSHALSALTFGSSSLISNSTPTTRGYAFNVLNPAGITVTSLSVWDENGDGFIHPHDVGLWNSSGTLLASATVNAGTVNPLSANGQFRTAAIPNLFLPQGNNYVVGAVFPFPSFDRQNRSAAFTTPSDISLVEGRITNGALAILFFPVSTGNSDPVAGGSFEFIPGVGVPFEFSPTLGLSVLGGLWLGKRLIKQVKNSKAKA